MPHPSQSQPWYRRLIVGIEIGPTGANDQDQVFMAQATGREFVAQLRRGLPESPYYLSWASVDKPTRFADLVFTR